MLRAIPILGVGSVEIRRGNPGEEIVLGNRLAAAGETFARAGKRIRLFHRIEEVAFLAAWDAARESGLSVPSGDDRAGIVLGIDEGIDGIRARHSIALRDDGPTGVSPLSFPITAHNAVTAQLSIALDLRGESFTFCGGSVSGAAALWAARQMLHDDRASVVLAGGATSVEKEFLEGLHAAGMPDPGGERDGACFLALGPARAVTDPDEAARPALVGYGEGFGERDVRDAVDACLEDAGVHLRDIFSVWAATPGITPVGEERGREGRWPVARPSPSADMYAASFPLTVAAALRETGGARPRYALIVGRDCLAGGAAVLVRS
ncbi:MAG TPA: beta-ketoacyl synthase N-terminal-like domain-containing protein [Candidatus Deferrimicrobiaceae bacterium]